MIATKFFDYLLKREKFDTKSMFGDVGLFYQDAMFALVRPTQIYIRGGGTLDHLLKHLKCSQYVFMKKQSTAKVNYYDITDLFLAGDPRLDDIIHRAKMFAFHQKKQKNSPDHRRLRDLPNLHLTIERMLKKAGISDVEMFLQHGAVQAYAKVKRIYGSTVTVKLLWKLTGAVEGIYWELIQEPKKQQLLWEYKQMTAIIREIESVDE